MPDATLRDRTTDPAPQPEPAGEAGATSRLAAEAAAFDLASVPAPVRRIAKLALLDWYAVAWAGAAERPIGILRQIVERDGGTPEGRLIRFGGRLPAPAAAWVNGAAGHVLDYDDVQNEVPGHATAPVAPAVLASAEAVDASGTDLLAGFTLAFETTCRMGRLLSPGHFRRGWQGSTIVGPIGAAAGCGLLLGLDAAQMNAAIGLAVAQAAGVQAAFGSDSKCVSVGNAARAGVIASRLAQRGIGSPTDILEAPRGFAAVYADGANPAHAFEAPFGGWHLCRNLFKHHAACFMAHGTLEALRRIRDEVALNPDTVQSVTIRVEGDYHRVVLTPPPRTGLEAKFNLAFCAALLIAGRDTSDPGVFSDALARDGDLHALARLCHIEIAPEIPFTAAEVVVSFRDGRTASRYVDVGEPESDLDRLETRVRAKAALLLSEAPSAARDDVIDAFLDLEAVSDLRALHAAGAA